MKLVSDFDGIWTNHAKEAEYVWNFILDYVSELTGKDKSFISGILNECRNQMNNEPYKYGWFNGGKIAAYYHEDPFGDNNAIFDYIDKTGISEGNEFLSGVKLIRDSILKKYESLAAFSQDSFYLSTSKFKEEGKLSPVESAASVADKIISLNTEIVVVSNSKPLKIKYVFEKAGIEIGEVPGSKVRARGDAGKFLIDNSFEVLPDSIEINKHYSVPLRRKGYYKTLLEEMPDFVIGDVFSLDIALPLFLHMNHNGMDNLKLIQRVQPYTPDWVKDFLNKDEFKGKVYIIYDLEELPEIISANLK